MSTSHHTLEKIGEKFCRVCEKVKPVNEFYKNKSYTCGYASKCKDCSRSHQRSYQKHKSEDVISYQLNRKYGIDSEVYKQMLDEQQGRCRICNTHQDDLTRRLAVDHCHETGKVRGLLCAPCNTALGNFKDNTELLNNAINYLNESTGNLRVDS